MNVLGRNVVILGGNSEIGPPYLAVANPQTVKGLRARDFMNEMEVYIEEIGLAWRGMDDVAIPHFLGKCQRLGHPSIQPSDRPVHTWQS